MTHTKSGRISIPFCESPSPICDTTQSMRNHDIIHEIPFMHCLCSECMHCRLFSVTRDDPAIADPYVGLVNIFDPSNDGLFIAQASRVPNPCKIFTLLPVQCPKDGDPIIMLTDMDWRGVVAAGSSILACLSVPHAHFPTSDVNLFLYGMSIEEAETKITTVYETIKESVPYEAIVLRLYVSIGEILADFDIDAPCFAFDGEYVWGSPHSIAEVMRRANTVDMSHRSPSLENRLAKYAMRGYEVLVPSLNHDKINDRIYRVQPSMLKGLACLLSLECIATSGTDGMIDTQVIDEAMDSCDLTENSDYSHFHIPYGPGWDAAKIIEFTINANFVLNDEEMQISVQSGEGWQLCRHPAFHGTACQCITGTCLDCAEPRTEHERNLRQVWDQFYVCRHVHFHPIDDGDWSEQAYSFGPECMQQPSEQIAWRSQFKRTLELLKKSLRYTHQAMESIEIVLQIHQQIEQKYIWLYKPIARLKIHGNV
ncbi:hypothetical protein F5146DRAFT_1000312 [Armillaria mellea]|nr:hypothetical protein F5146DRAFT_1000312 [Armillaria mellea]